MQNIEAIENAKRVLGFAAEEITDPEPNPGNDVWPTEAWIDWSWRQARKAIDKA